MGGVVGSVIGAAGSIIGGQQAASASKKAAMIQAAAADRAGERALTGYKYLTEGAGAKPMQGYIDAGQRALGNQGTTQNLMMDLLGITNYGNQTRPAAPAPAANGGGGAPAPTGAPENNLPGGQNFWQQFWQSRQGQQPMGTYGNEVQGGYQSFPTAWSQPGVAGPTGGQGATSAVKYAPGTTYAMAASPEQAQANYNAFGFY